MRLAIWLDNGPKKQKGEIMSKTGTVRIGQEIKDDATKVAASLGMSLRYLVTVSVRRELERLEKRTK